MVGTKPKRTLAVLAAGLWLSGCSVSYSVGKSSDSVEGISGSLTSSFAADADELATTYQSDLGQYTVVALSAGASTEDFLHGIQRVAAEHGISDWAGTKTTYLGIGAGLREAGVAAGTLAQHPLVATFAQQPDHLALILAGYRS